MRRIRVEMRQKDGSASTGNQRGNARNLGGNLSTPVEMTE